MVYYTYYSFETNKGIDGRGYIGSRKCPKTTTPELDSYWGSQKSPKNQDFKNNPNKDKIILGVFNSAEQALEHEVYLHSLWKVASNPHFANQAEQTSKSFTRLGTVHTEESKEKMRVAKTGTKLSEEHKRKIGAESKARIRTPLSQKTRDKISKAHSGKSLTTEHKARLSAVSKGEKGNNYEGKRYTWYNKSTGVTHYNTTVIEMTNMYPDLSSRRSRLYKIKSVGGKCKGWTVINPDNQQK